jgi:3D (Asp-Asp-Asp) domain-containing protein
MNKRWQRRIDIYMGNELERALEWGRRAVTLSW